jgi:predicted HicB family RNase H-like nuclease
MSKRETIEIEIEEELLYQLMLLAHERDITLNQLVENILREFIDRDTVR